jgi:hypothetical protein
MPSSALDLCNPCRGRGAVPFSPGSDGAPQPGAVKYNPSGIGEAPCVRLRSTRSRWQSPTPQSPFEGGARRLAGWGMFFARSRCNAPTNF